MTLSKPGQKRLVYLSPVSLSSFAQRPHHFVDWFHRRFDAEVVWIDPGPSRFPRWNDWRRVWGSRSLRSLGPSWAQAPWVQRVQFPTLPLEPLRWGRWINRMLRQHDLAQLDAFVDENTWIVFGKPCDLALELCGRYPQATTVFDVMDSMSAFSHGWASQWMATAEDELVRHSRWILTSSTALEARFAQYAPKVRKAMNGLSSPPALAPRSAAGAAPCVLGYVGLIASWFDWDAVIRLAKLASNAEVWLIGPCECSVPSDLPSNIRLLPPIAHNAVYSAMQDFSVGLIPFKVNALTEFVDPVKYYEYRALGLPVLSSCFGEMRQRSREDGVFFFEDLQDSVALSTCLQHCTDAATSGAFCETHNWDAHFDTVDFFDR